LRKSIFPSPFSALLGIALFTSLGLARAETIGFEDKEDYALGADISTVSAWKTSAPDQGKITGEGSGEYSCDFQV
jgi:hypothetical protein